MIRGFASHLVLLAGAALASGQDASSPPQAPSKPSPTLPHRRVGDLAAAQGINGEYRLTIRPAPSPSPALRYQLLPELRDRTPGNAALLYYRAFAPEWTAYRRPEVRKLIDQWFDDKSQPPAPQLRWLVDTKQLKE